MNGLYLQYGKLWKVPTKDRKKVNYFASLTEIMGYLWLYYIFLEKGIQLIVEYNIGKEEGILIQGKGNYCLKLKKRKLKTKKLLKITILGEQEHSVQ